MTPKEKAKELVDKFLKCKDLSNSYYILPIIEDAKQLALIAVEELHIQTNKIIESKYWQEVKQEIEKL